HPRSHRMGGHTTLDTHMPKAHQKQQQWTPMRFEKWAAQIGDSTEQLVIQILQAKKHPEQSYRVCLGLLSLAKKYSPERLEAACHRALAMGVSRLKSITNILAKGLDRQPLPETQPDLLADIKHTNIRGNRYYH
ncbi:MAG: IS21 family transposase, partial [Gammaproteobacteria bacterium]